MERGRRGYTTHQSYYHSLTNCPHFPHLIADSYTPGCPLADLQQAYSLGMTRRNDIGEMIKDR
jgi:hypothetical protein